MGTGPRPIDSPTRVVLDTSVVVSALVFETGQLAWLRSAWRKERIKPLVSKSTVKELLRVLAYPKFRLSPDEQEIFQADYLPFCESVIATVRVSSVPRCRDPHHRPFLFLALAGKADSLVSGDDDLLVLALQFAVPIVKPAELRTLLGLAE